jgi:N,N'-diacetyllegionaminate synthase
MSTIQKDRMTVMVGDHQVGDGQRCFIIAEAGVNHNGDLKIAHELIDIAADAKADAVKFQTFKTDQVVSPEAQQADYQVVNTKVRESQRDMVRRLELPFSAFRELHSHCSSRAIMFLSTPFDYESAEFLKELGVSAIKIASGEITNYPFLDHLAKMGLPLILSTGMSTLEEVDEAVRVILSAANNKLILLQCVSDYPAKPSSVNLRSMATMARSFRVPVGFSDHTTGIEVAFAAAALGACIVEKHFTLDRDLAGPDHRASLKPSELTAMVKGIRNIEQALGNGEKLPTAEEKNTSEVARRSLAAAHLIKAGTILTEEMIAILRPGTGLAPSMRSRLRGKRAKFDIQAGSLILLNMLQEEEVLQ